MYHIYSQDHLPSTGSATVLTNVCTTSTHKTIYHPLALLLSLLSYVTHLLIRLFTTQCHCTNMRAPLTILFTINWLCCFCPFCLMYQICSQDYLPLAETVLTACTTSTHKTLYHPLPMSLLPYEPHLHKDL